VSVEAKAPSADGPGQKGPWLTRRLAVAGVVAGAITAATCGAALASASAGRASSSRSGITINWDGPWRAGASYVAGDAVSAAGSSYVASRASRGEYPSPSSRFWQVLAAGGQPGQAGLQGPRGATGPVGTGKYAFFYNAPTADITVAGDSDIQFPDAGAQSGSIVTASGGDQWTFTSAGAYTIAVCVPFQAGGSFYQVVFKGKPVAGSSVGGYNQEPYCETVVLAASAGDAFGIQNPQDGAETIAGFSDSQLLIQQISS
jgi:hypothetical protein